jgi:rod shape-determining protein MreC
MVKYLREYRFYIILFAFILIPVIAIDTSTRSPRDYRFYDKVIVFITAPIQFTITWTLEQMASGFQNYVYLWHTREENLALVDENRKLLSSIEGLRETEQENIRLRKLLNFEEQTKSEAVVARVIAKDVSTDFRAIRINRGEKSGIRRNMAVVSYEGIVGRVLRTTAGTADVVTILDLLSAVDVINERSRARGVFEGLTDDSGILRYTVRTDDIQPGDPLISSGLGGIFPKGKPVGIVTKVTKKPFGISQDVEVRPSVDFSKLEEVLVLTHFETEIVSSAKNLAEPTASDAGPGTRKEKDKAP